MCTGVFPEPWAFTQRARTWLQAHRADFDLVHDNQSSRQRDARDDGRRLADLRHAPPPDHRRPRPRARAREERLRSASTCSAGTRSSDADEGRAPGPAPRDRERELAQGHRRPDGRRPRAAARSCRSASTRTCSVRSTTSRASRAGCSSTTSSDVPLKGLVPLLEAVAKVRTERDDVHLVVIGKPKDRLEDPRAAREARPRPHVEFVSGVSTERIVELYAECELAVVPSLYEGFSLPAIEAMSCAAPLVATTGGALPEVIGPSGEAALTVPPNDPRRARRPRSSTMLDEPELRARLGAAGRARILDRFTWRKTAEGMIENWYETLEIDRARPPTRGSALTMLTVDFDRLQLATRRHAPRHGLRRRPPRVRGDAARRVGARARLLRGRAQGRARHRRRDARGGRDPGDAAVAHGQRRRAAPAVPRRRRSTASSCSEVLEHIWDDERRDHRARARAASPAAAWR